MRRRLNIPRPPRLSPLLNQVIDELFHPLGERDRFYYVLDSIAHFAVEQADSVVESLYKTVRYNAGRILYGKGSRRGRGGEARGG